MRRIEALDFLRGLMALAVMLYHYGSSASDSLPSSTLLGKLGIYAVSTFYILSGLSLALVYANSMRDTPSVVVFYIRRFFRIAPLFLVATTAAIVLKSIKYGTSSVEFPITPIKLLLNYSLTFGFFAPTSYFATGAWSIGNELVFYAFFPLLMVSSPRVVVPIALLCSLSVAGVFTFSLMKSGVPLAAQWHLYVNPFNQAYLFLAGVAIGVFFPATSTQARAWPYVAAALALALIFWLYPANGDQATITTGWPRVMLSLCCISIVLCTYLASARLQAAASSSPVAWVGRTCYSVYLLHPLVGGGVVYAMGKIGGNIYVSYAISVVGTLALSHHTYKYLEQPMIRFGKTFSKRWAKV